MYVRLKIFEKKLNKVYNKPIFFYESNGTNAVRLAIISVINRYYGDRISEQVKQILISEDEK
jgi:hypothetical protein